MLRALQLKRVHGEKCGQYLRPQVTNSARAKSESESALAGAVASHNGKINGSYVIDFGIVIDFIEFCIYNNRPTCFVYNSLLRKLICYYNMKICKQTIKVRLLADSGAYRSPVRCD